MWIEINPDEHVVRIDYNLFYGEFCKTAAINLLKEGTDMKVKNKRYMKPKRKYARRLLRKDIRKHKNTIAGYYKVFNADTKPSRGPGNNSCYRNKRTRYILFNILIRNSEVNTRRKK